MLLILAGVRIITLTGDNGIITRTHQAKQLSEEAAAKEKVQLAVQAARIHDKSYSSLKAEEVRTAVNNEEGLSTAEKGDFPVVVTAGLYQFTIDENGNVSKAGSSNPVTPATVSVTGVTISAEGGTANQDGSITIAPEGTVTLTANVAPNNATNKSLTWTIADSSVIKLSSTSVTTDSSIPIEGVAVGEKNVTVTTSDGSFQASKVIKVESSQQSSTVKKM